jgi:hypothetical protein
MSDFRLPSLTHRTAVIGRTGSGKTQAAAWLLSLADFHKQPWVIVDYKRDSLLNAIPHVKKIGFDTVPTEPGLYLLQPLPHQKEQMEEWLWKVWARGRIGLYFDELTLVPDPKPMHGGGALRAIYVMGRSKRIPTISVTQRPRNISRYLFSEADYFQVFHLNTKGDVDAVKEFTPFDMKERLERYNSRWYDVNEHRWYLMRPVEDARVILDRFTERLRPKTRFL